MGAFLSALAGAGNAAQGYNDKMLQLWSQSRDYLSKSIAQARDASLGDPGRYAALSNLLSKVATAKPGVPQDKLAQEFQELTQVHPSNVKLMQRAGVPGTEEPERKGPPTPGPAAPGAVPGSLPSDQDPLSQMLIPGGMSPIPASMLGGMGGGEGGRKSPAPVQASMPAVNPISPSSVSGGSAGAPVGQVGPVGQQGIPAVSPAATAATAPAMRDPRAIMESIYGPYLEAGFISPAAQDMLGPLLSFELNAELQNRGVQNTQAANAEKLYEVDGNLVDRNGRVVFSAPQKAGSAAGPRVLNPGDVLVDVSGKPLYTAPGAPGAAGHLQQKTEVDDKGNVWAWNFNPVTGESGPRTNLGKMGKERQPYMPGQFIPLVSPTGEITSFYNPKTNENKKPPEAGARRTPLPPAENTRRGQLGVMQDQIERLVELSGRHGGQIGPVAGRATSAKLATFGYDNPEIAEMARISGNLSDMLLRARSGAQINEQEYARLSKLVPNINMPLSTFKSSLNSFRQEVNALTKGSTGGEMGNPSIPPIGGGKSEGKKTAGAAGAAGVIVQRNKRTGEYRHSTDGGKTWINGKP